MMASAAVALAMSTIGVNAAAALAGLVIVIGLIVYAALAASFRIVRDDGRLRLVEMLRKQGTAPDEALSVGGYQAAIAVRRCMFLGQYTPAIAAAEELIATIPEAVLRIESPPMVDFLEGYLTMKQHVLVRFGKWREIIAQELPKDRDLYCSNVAMIHYAKAVAHSALGNVAEAEAERALFVAAKARVPESRRVHNNKMINLLEVGQAMLDGELEYRKGNHEEGWHRTPVRPLEADAAE